MPLDKKKIVILLQWLLVVPNEHRVPTRPISHGKNSTIYDENSAISVRLTFLADPGKTPVILWRVSSFLGFDSKIVEINPNKNENDISRKKAVIVGVLSNYTDIDWHTNVKYVK